MSTSSVTDGGFTFTFSANVTTGRYSPATYGGNTYLNAPFVVIPPGGSVTISGISNPSLPASAGHPLVASWTTETYAAAGPACTGSNNPYTNPASPCRLQLNGLTVTSPSFPKTLHVTWVDPVREAAESAPLHLRPHTENHGYIVFVSSIPTTDAMRPPALGRSAFKLSALSRAELNSNLWKFQPTLPLPSAGPTFDEMIPYLCGYSMLSPYENLSGGRSHHDPMGPRDSQGVYHTEFGTGRAAWMGDAIRALLAATPAQRAIGTECFVERHLLNFVGMVGSDYATDEGGGLSVGIELAVWLSKLMLPSNPEIHSALLLMNQAGRTASTQNLRRSRYNCDVTWGTRGTPDEEFRCLVGDPAVHWGAGSHSLCGYAVQEDADLNEYGLPDPVGPVVFDMGWPGAYMEMQAGGFLNTSFALLEVPALRAISNAAYPRGDLMVDWVQKYLTRGVQTMNPTRDTQFLHNWRQAIINRNVATTAPPIDPAHADSEMADAAAANGYRQIIITHRNDNLYHWMLNYYGATEP